MAIVSRWHPAIARSALDLLFPPQCGLCHAELVDSMEILLCDECRNEVLGAASFRCPRCAGSAPWSLEPGERCGHCRAEQLHFSRAVAIGIYHGALKEAVLRMKSPECSAL